ARPKSAAETIEQGPLLREGAGWDQIVIEKLNRPAGERDLAEWRAMVERMRHPRHEVEIAVVGKYVAAPDAYLSVVEALTHGGAAHDTRVKIRWVPSEDLEHQPADRVLDGVDGILVPGGFGSRGVEGMVVAARYARERK